MFEKITDALNILLQNIWDLHDLIGFYLCLRPLLVEAIPIL